MATSPDIRLVVETLFFFVFFFVFFLVWLWFFGVEQQTTDSVLLTEGLADISGLGSTYKDGRGSTYKGCCEHQKTWTIHRLKNTIYLLKNNLYYKDGLLFFGAHNTPFCFFNGDFP